MVNVQRSDGLYNRLGPFMDYRLVTSTFTYFLIQNVNGLGLSKKVSKTDGSAEKSACDSKRTRIGIELELKLLVKNWKYRTKITCRTRTELKLKFPFLKNKN